MKAISVRQFNRRVNAFSRQQRMLERESRLALKEQTKKLLCLIPEWRNKKTADADRVEIVAWAKSRGISDRLLPLADRDADCLAHLYKAWKNEIDAERYRLSQDILSAA